MDLMDRQKTIEMLEELKAKDPFDRYEKQNIGIDWAIDAVKAASSVQTCDDAVSRQAAIDELYKMLHDCFWADDEELDAVITTLNELPSVQPQQTCEYWDSESKFCALCRPSAQPEIIRCKDCKHHHYESEDIPYCDRIDYGYGWKDYDFCSRAERRTDE